MQARKIKHHLKVLLCEVSWSPDSYNSEVLNTFLPTTTKKTPCWPLPTQPFWQHYKKACLPKLLIWLVFRDHHSKHHQTRHTGRTSEHVVNSYKSVLQCSIAAVQFYSHSLDHVLKPKGISNGAPQLKPWTIRENLRNMQVQGDFIDGMQIWWWNRLVVMFVDCINVCTSHHILVLLMTVAPFKQQSPRERKTATNRSHMWDT